ncbi:Cut8-domain-containing protein [Patellaria atrata CBS 101060]|uniref:Tethering factor for nuclear proteasome STS1 n=1 Tax=Patellaria atrata CBS 101060 TaxID=1346257 RepID=A0A9P4SDC2_9PEZI|nr:Cut8-domain-containing protein [Patellaria atrata CBS 101060]
MNSILASQPFLAPHLLPNNRLSPPRLNSSNSNNMAGRKRKADDDTADRDERMTSASPSSSPSLASRILPQSGSHRITKRPRTNLTGRPLPLARLLETLGADDMRSLLQSICDRHPQIGQEVVTTAPRPSVASALSVLNNYESTVRSSFPFGGRPSSDYSYNRVRQSLMNLLDALKDYTPHFLPPHEAQPATSLNYLDGATDVIHRLQDWDSYQNNRHKQDAYEEMAKAWALVIQEATKRGGGIQLQYGGWDQKLAKHNELSGGKMQVAVDALRTTIGFMGTGSGSQHPQGGSNVPADIATVRQQLLNGTYGQGVRVGPW